MRPPVVEGMARALKAPLRHLPFDLQRIALENLLNLAFRRDIEDGELEFLSGRTLAVEVSDLGWCWPITLDTGRLVLRHPGCRPDTRIRAETGELAALAVGHRDPDTLFFQRRLAVEGDTELGLALKNYLDGMEPDAPPLRLLARAARALRRINGAMPARGARGPF